MERNKPVSYKYPFKNGIITISRGVETRYDWLLKIDLDRDKDDNKQFICLDQNIFLTRKSGLEYAKKLLKKYKLWQNLKKISI